MRPAEVPTHVEKGEAAGVGRERSGAAASCLRMEPRVDLGLTLDQAEISHANKIGSRNGRRTRLSRLPERRGPREPSQVPSALG